MRKIVLKILAFMLSFYLIASNTSAQEDLSETELNVFTGMFDFSDHKQKAGLIGLQHQNDDLFRKSFLGRLSHDSCLFQFYSIIKPRTRIVSPHFNSSKILKYAVFEIAKIFESKMINNQYDLNISGFYKNNPFLTSPKVKLS